MGKIMNTIAVSSVVFSLLDEYSMAFTSIDL